jgi:hypothetical protein
VKAAAVRVDPLAEVRAELAEVRERLARLETRFGARDAAEAAVLPAIAAAIGSRRFTSAELKAHSEVDDALGAALEAADVESVRELGKLLARLEVRPIGGLTLTRLSESRRGLIWVVRL